MPTSPHVALWTVAVMKDGEEVTATAGVTGPPQAPVRRRRGARFLLAAGSFLFTFLLLELATRVFVPLPAPVRIRDGVYVTRLAKVNGFDSRGNYSGARLETRKRAGEIRIAVFGESTVQGTPWGAWGSPVAMLRDHLSDVMPEKDVTVLNMGRGGGFTIDAYYFLVSLARYRPDYVIFYQGANDDYSVDGEMCVPANHPTIHRAWRFLVEHSRLVWSVRALGPVLLTGLRRKGNKDHSIPPRLPNRCDPEAGFKAWTDLLIETAEDMGAKVIVTTPVSNPLRWAELDGQFGGDAPLRLEEKDVHYRRLLACVLSTGCDLATAWNEEGGGRYAPILWLEPRVRISLESAARHGARSIDFHDYLARHMSGGLRPLVFIDEMHLTLDGLWLLSWLWTREVASLMDGRTLAPLPPPVNAEHYLADITRDMRQGLACIFLRTVPIFWRANMPLVGAVQLRLAIDAEVRVPGTRATSRAGMTAQLLAGWLRRKLGMDAALPPALIPFLDGVDIGQTAAELQKEVDCSRVGGPGLEALAVDKGLAEGEKDGHSRRLAQLHIIPKDAEKVVAAMLGGIEPGGCKLEEAEIRQTFIHAIYKCPDGHPAAVDLRHPSEAVGAAEKTDRFALVASEPAPPPGFIHDLAAALRGKEAPFEWKQPELRAKDGEGDGTPP